MGPVIPVGVDGALLTARVLATEEPHALLATTLMFPETKMVLLMVTEIVLVVEVPVIPVGRIQV